MWKKRWDRLSVQVKLFAGILTISILLAAVITGTAIVNTYDEMNEQLIYNRRMSIGWLKERLELELSGYQEQFYEFEVDQTSKEAIQSWCLQGEELDYASQWRLITAMNEIVSMDSSLNGMEIYNLKTGEVLVAQRSGASLEEAGDRLERWELRQEGLQTNLVFLREEREILILHQMHRFSDKEPYAVIVMRLRPYDLQDILENIKMTPDESVLVLNDEDEWVEADYGELGEEDFPEVQSVAKKLRDGEKTEFLLDGNYWFYQEVSGGKLRLLLSVPDHVILDSLRGTILVAVLIGVLMILVSAVAAVIFSRVFSNPIVGLARRMRNFTLNKEENQDQEEVSPPCPGTRNEITLLQQSFDIMVDRNQRLIAQEYQAELEKREAQIHALQAQINPHFMYNVMQVIGGMALERKAPEIYRVTTALGDLMRYCLNFSREMVALQEEIHYLQSYCMLQNERFGGRIALNIDAEEETLGLMIPKLILQPVLENSFHHGLASRGGSWVITVRGRLKREAGRRPLLVLTVTDNGAGMTRERLLQVRESLNQDAPLALKSGAHIGLCNVNARIRLNCPEEGCGLTVDSQEGAGTTVTITMAVEVKKDEL